jgi:hypothetical protein
MEQRLRGIGDDVELARQQPNVPAEDQVTRPSRNSFSRHSVTSTTGGSGRP